MHCDFSFQLVRMALDSEQPLEVLLMTPVQRPIQIKTLLEKIAECFQKAGEDEIYNSVKAALKISDEINKYSNDMMKAGRIRNFEVSNLIYLKKKFQNLVFVTNNHMAVLI